MVLLCAIARHKWLYLELSTRLRSALEKDLAGFQLQAGISVESTWDLLELRLKPGITEVRWWALNSHITGFLEVRPC